MQHSTVHPASGRFQFAAIFSEQGDVADKVIEQVILQLQNEGKNVAGFCQQSSFYTRTDCASRVVNIENGSTFKLSQATDANAVSSRLDTSTLGQTAEILLKRLNNETDAVTINRFGHYESDGDGFCCVINRAMELNIPLLTVVHSRWQQRWHDFAPGQMTTLRPSYGCVLKWCHAAMLRSHGVN